jgi:2-amino-4-hydroxy-6-hydroxymethyldihydropteridine diphosphokinase
LKRYIFVAFGGNLPVDVGSASLDPLKTLQRAVVDLGAAGLTLVAQSRFFTTPCFPAGAGPDYINAAAVFLTDLPPAAILQILHQVEAFYGRERVSRWAGRTLDLDLIACADEVLPDAATHRHWRDLPVDIQAQQAPDQLILPHPRLQDRGFVLVPLADIAPDWVHPILGLSVAAMLAALAPEARADILPIPAAGPD